MSRTARLDPATLALLTIPPILWAGNAIVGRLAVGLIAPMMLNALRWLIAAIVLLPFAWRGLVEHRDELKRTWVMLAVLGVLGMGCYNALQYLALTTSAPVNVTLIASSGPVFALLFGALFFGQAVTRFAMLGALVSIVGVLVVLVHGDPSRLLTLDFVPGDLFMVAAAATFSLYTWLLRTRRPALPSVPLLFAQTALGCVFCLACALVERVGFGAVSHIDTPKAWAILAYVGLCPAVIAYLAWERGVARAGAAVPVFFSNLQPVFTALMSTLLLGEAPHAYHVAGLVLIVIGIVLARR